MHGKLARMVASGAISLPVVGRFGRDQYSDALAPAVKYSKKAIPTNGR